MRQTDRVIADLVTATDSGRRIQTLLEVAVASAVVAFLIGFVLSQTDLYKARAQSLEAFGAWTPVRADLVEYRAQRGYWPTATSEVDAEALSSDQPGAIARTVELGEGGSLTVVFGDEQPVEGLKGRRLTFRPALFSADPGAPMIWFCGSYRLPRGFVASGRDLSDLAPAYLPSQCKDFPRS